MSDTAELSVYGAWPGWGVGDISPACLKLKTYLRMAGLEYRARRGDPRRGPTKKIPYIKDGERFIGDSGMIIAHLQKTRGAELDARLGAADHALGHALRRMVEESLYWVIITGRWVEDDSAAEMQKAFAPILPPVIGGLVFSMIRGQVRKSSKAHGLGRHPREDQYGIGKADLDCLAGALGDKPYFFGDEPTSYDAAIYGQLGNALAFPKDLPLASHGRTHANLVAFCDRIKERYWKSDDEVT